MPLEEAKELGFENFRNADPLWNAEVCFILQQHLKDRENPSSSLKGTPVNAMIHKTLDYVRKLNNYATKENLDMSQKLFKKSRKFTQYESTLINNLNIGSVDEAFTLIPSLRDKFPQTEQLAQILENFQDYQKHDDSYGYNIHDTTYLDEIENENDNENDNENISNINEMSHNLNNNNNNNNNNGRGKDEIDDYEDEMNLNNNKDNNNGNEMGYDNDDSGVGMYSPENEDIDIQSSGLAMGTNANVIDNEMDGNDDGINGNGNNDNYGSNMGHNQYQEQGYDMDDTGDADGNDTGENMIDID